MLYFVFVAVMIILKKQYEKMFKYIKENNLKIKGFSREIALIDYGITNDVNKFVTEIQIPVEDK